MMRSEKLPDLEGFYKLDGRKLATLSGRWLLMLLASSSEVNSNVIDGHDDGTKSIKKLFFSHFLKKYKIEFFYVSL